MRRLIVAIDGPSGAGKSTLSKKLAKALGYVTIDTGAMYRSVALASLRAGLSSDDSQGLAALCRTLKIEFAKDENGDRIICNGEDVSDAIRTPEVSLLTSAVATVAEVREEMVRLQRLAGKSGGVVLEGRDIGTAVFPDADVKFFLDASATERGKRRFEELVGKGINVDLEQTVAEVVERDRQDTERSHSPLRQAEDAILVDSTRMTIDQVLLFMQNEIKSRIDS